MDIKENQKTPINLAEVMPKRLVQHRYNTVQDVKRGLQRVLNDIENERMSIPIGKTLIYGLQVMVGVMTSVDLESRLKLLETKEK